MHSVPDQRQLELHDYEHVHKKVKERVVPCQPDFLRRRRRSDEESGGESCGLPAWNGKGGRRGRGVGERGVDLEGAVERVEEPGLVEV